MASPSGRTSDYLKRSGDDEILQWSLLEGERGFMTWRAEGEAFVIGNVYGDGAFWNAVAEEMARERGCQVIRFATRRRPEGFVKKYGYRVVGYILERQIDG